MKKGSLAIALLITASAFAQQTQFARGIYARNGVLIGLTDLAPLKDCSVQVADGKARDVDVVGNDVSFEIKSGEERKAFKFSLTSLDPSERKIFRRDFLKKGLRLRATGYACDGNAGPLETIRIDRVY
jgi:hypothetical protein